MKNYLLKNWKTSLGALLALIGLGLYWGEVINKDEFAGGMAIVVIYIGLVAADSKK